MQIMEGSLSAKDMKLAIIVSRFNEFISERLLTSAVSTIIRSGGREEDVTVYKVPGAFEIPLMAKKLAQSRKYDGILCLGAVIRGGTPHFDYIATEMAKGIAHVNLETGVPVAFGVITADNLEQAIERAGAKMGNKGETTTLALIEMVSLLKKSL